MNDKSILLTITEVDNLVDKYSMFIKEVHVHPSIIFPFFMILLTAFIIRGFLWIKSCDIKSKNKMHTYFYIAEHCVFEFAIGFIISYLIIILTYADIANYTINFGLAPAIGIVAAIYIDNKIIISLEKENGVIGTMFKSSKKESSSGGSDVNVIVNTSGSNSDVTTTNSVDNLLSTMINANLITESDLTESDDINNLFRVAINQLKENQYHQARELEKQSQELTKQSEVLDAMRDTMMIDKKIKLKKLMYECLDQGYATPDQNDVIVDMYKNYLRLGGNGKVKELYEKHYLLLKIHNERSPQQYT